MKWLIALLLAACVSHTTRADTINIAVQSDALPTQYYSNVTSAYNITYGVWQLGLWEDQHGFEINAITNQVSTLNVFISGSDFMDPYTGGSTLQYYIRTMPDGWTLESSLYVDPLNRPFQGYKLDGAFFTSATVWPGTVENYALWTDSPYAITAAFLVQSNGATGELTADTNIGHSVPAPIAGVGIPGMMAALAGLLWLLRRRRVV